MNVDCPDVSDRRVELPPPKSRQSYPDSRLIEQMGPEDRDLEGQSAGCCHVMCICLFLLFLFICFCHVSCVCLIHLLALLHLLLSARVLRLLGEWSGEEQDDYALLSGEGFTLYCVSLCILSVSYVATHRKELVIIDAVEDRPQRILRKLCCSDDEFPSAPRIAVSLKPPPPRSAGAPSVPPKPFGISPPLVVGSRGWTAGKY